MPKSSKPPESDAAGVDDEVGPRRKPRAERRENGLTFWFTDEEKALLVRAADGLPLSPWGRRALVEYARSAVKKGKAK